MLIYFPNPGPDCGTGAWSRGCMAWELTQQVRFEGVRGPDGATAAEPQKVHQSTSSAVDALDDDVSGVWKGACSMCALLWHWEVAVDLSNFGKSRSKSFVL